MGNKYNTDILTRKSIIANVLSGSFNAIQSVVWIAVINRVFGITEAGIFTIAYTSANLFLNIGNYGIRDFQVSDVKNTYFWREYYVLRIITIIAMICACTGYCIFMHYFGLYSVYKTLIIFFMTLLKAADAYENVYHGMYQKNGRLDIAGRAMSLRLGLQIIVMIICMIVIKNMLYALIITTFFSWACLFIQLKKNNKFFEFEKDRVRRQQIKNLFLDCTPLAISVFLMGYSCNASKYAIDYYMGDEQQAYFGYIFMPVTVTYLFSNFICQPILKNISELWTYNKKRELLKKIYFTAALIGIVCVGILIAGWFLGIPVLNLLYGVDLYSQKGAFMILLFGSAFYAFSSLFNILLTIMRKQLHRLYINIIICLSSACITTYMVKNFGIMGASLSYLIIMGIMMFLFLNLVVKEIRRV